mgnify:CR=1 FL=1
MDVFLETIKLFIMLIYSFIMLTTQLVKAYFEGMGGAKSHILLFVYISDPISCVK